MVISVSDATGSPEPQPFELVIDIELTNRCNASCSFCPREETRHQGLMVPEVFEQTLLRATEYRDWVVPAAAELDIPLRAALDGSVAISFCGLGEQLLHPSVSDYVARVSAAGLRSVVNTNASLLCEEKGQALLDAGVDQVFINAGERDDEYEEVYGLPFERTRANIERFAHMAEGRCEVSIVLVDHRQDKGHQGDMDEYWRELGVNRFFKLDLLNRAGSLFVTYQSYEDNHYRADALDRYPSVEQAPVCAAPFVFPFIGYDGTYYLCSSDWKKEVGLGTIFERSLIDVMDDKMARVRSRQPICASCNHDPLNKLSDALRTASEGDGSDAFVEDAAILAENGDLIARTLHGAGSAEAHRRAVDAVRAPHRPRIPVRSVSGPAA